MAYSLIIFDCDGTLVDSEYLNTVAIVEILHEFGLTNYSVKQALDEFVGLRFSTILQNITKGTGHIFPDNAAKLYLKRVRELAIEDSVTGVTAAIGVAACIILTQTVNRDSEFNDSGY